MTAPAIAPALLFLAGTAVSGTTLVPAAAVAAGASGALAAGSTAFSSSKSPAWPGLAFSAAATCCAVTEERTTSRLITPESSLPASTGRRLGAGEGRDGATDGGAGVLRRAPDWLARAAISFKLVRLRSVGGLAVDAGGRVEAPSSMDEAPGSFSSAIFFSPDRSSTPASPGSGARAGLPSSASSASPGGPFFSSAAFTIASARSSHRRSWSSSLPEPPGSGAGQRASRESTRCLSPRFITPPLRSRARRGTRAACVELRAPSRPRCPPGNRAPWTHLRGRGRRYTRG